MSSGRLNVCNIARAFRLKWERYFIKKSLPESSASTVCTYINLLAMPIVKVRTLIPLMGNKGEIKTLNSESTHHEM